MKVSFDIDASEAINAFMKMALKTQGSTLKKAVRRGAKPIIKMGRSLSPVKTGGMKKSLKFRPSKPKKVYSINGLQQGIAKGKVNFGTREELGIPQDAKYYYPYALEYGSVRGHKAGSYLGRAFGQKENEAFHIMRDFIINEALKKFQ